MNPRQAFKVMLDAHAGQDDKVGEPYFFHPIAVEERVRGLGDDFRVVALLHDVFEDTEAQVIDFVMDVFTGRMDTDLWLTPLQTEALIAITHNPGEPHGTYMRRVKGDFIASVVKWADMDHNLDPERRKGLDAATAKRMADKYERGRVILLGGEPT